MKKTFPLLLLSSLLVLASCTTSSSSTASSEDSSTSSSTTSSASSENTSSSSGGASSTTLPPPVTGWSDEEKGVITSILGKHDIPYVDEYGEDIDYQIGTDYTTSGDGAVFVILNNVDLSLIDDVVTVHKETAGYEELNFSGVPENMKILYAEYNDLTQIQLQISTYNMDGSAALEGVGIIQIAYIGLIVNFDTFPGEQLAQKALVLNEYTDGETSLTIPEITGADEYILASLTDQYDTEYAGLLMSGVTAEEYSAVLKDAGLNDAAISSYGEDSYYYITEDDLFGILTWNGEDGYTYVQVLLNTVLLTWPEEEIASYFAYYEITFTGTIPEPIGDIEFYTLTDYFGSLYIDAYLGETEDGNAILETYINTLLEEGWEAIAYINNEYYYLSPEKEVMLCAAYLSDYHCLDLFIQEYMPNYVNVWPEEVIANVVTTLSNGEATAVVPTPAFDWDFGTIYDSTSYGSNFNIDLQDIAEDGTYVPHAEDYAAQLNASSDWTYNPDDDVWYDTASQSVQISIEDTEDCGLSIYIDVYDPVLTELTQQDIADGLTAAGIETESVIPLFTAGNTYRVTTSTSTVNIDITGTNQNDITAYEALLVEEGYIKNTAYGISLYTDEAKTVVIQVAVNSEDPTSSIIIIQAYDVWLASVDELTSMLMLIEIFTGVAVPFPETIDWDPTAIGFDLGTQMGSQYYTYYVIFDTGFATSLIEDLVTLGYTEVTTPNTGFTYTYEYAVTEGVSYYVDILEDTVNGFTVVAIS